MITNRPLFLSSGGTERIEGNHIDPNFARHFYIISLPVRPNVRLYTDCQIRAAKKAKKKN